MSLRLHHVARVGGLHGVLVRVVHRVLVGQAAVGQIVHHSVTGSQNCSRADAAGRFFVANRERCAAGVDESQAGARDTCE